MRNLEYHFLMCKLEAIMTKLSELDEALVALKDQLTVAKDDILVRISELDAALVNVSLTPEAEAALADLRASADAIDAIA